MRGGSQANANCALFLSPTSGKQQLRCTGDNRYGAVGCGSSCSTAFGVVYRNPVDAVGLPNDTHVAGVTSGGFHTVAWMADGSAATTPTVWQLRWNSGG